MNRVLQQLETGGMIEVLELMKRGYPCRIPYGDLWDRYSPVLPMDIKERMNAKDFAEIILLYVKANFDEYRIGNTMAFFRFGALSVREGVGCCLMCGVLKQVEAVYGQSGC